MKTDIQIAQEAEMLHIREVAAKVGIEGTITKGEYHGEIPVIEIEKIKETKTPSDEYVYPPDESYVPTSATL